MSTQTAPHKTRSSAIPDAEGQIQEHLNQYKETVQSRQTRIWGGGGTATAQKQHVAVRYRASLLSQKSATLRKKTRYNMER